MLQRVHPTGDGGPGGPGSLHVRGDACTTAMDHVDDAPDL